MNAPKWERALRGAAMVIGRLALAYLFFANMWWKAPQNDFGCKNFVFTTTAANGDLKRDGDGLCDWLGIEAHYANKDRILLQADLIYVGGPNLGVNIRPLAEVNATIIENIIKPNIRWMGYVIFYSEAAIAVLLALGLFSRLGGLIALGVSAQLMIGLANIPFPFEWEWGYNNMVVLSFMMLCLAPGRWLGLDQLLRKWLLPKAHAGSKLAKLVLLPT
jgi:hypothetical protein